MVFIGDNGKERGAARCAYHQLKGDKMPKKRRGPQNITKIDQLKKKANDKFDLAQTKQKEMLEAVKDCGTALNRIRWETDNWKKVGWERWIEQNFHGSLRTSQIYIRISKNWDHPRLKLARKRGFGPTSIRRFSDILKGRSLNKKTPIELDKDEARSIEIRQSLRKNFAESLRNLCMEELEAFDNAFDSYWEKTIYPKVYEGASNNLEEDLNTYLFGSGRLKISPKQPITKKMTPKQMQRLGEKAAEEDLRRTGVKKRIDHAKGLIQTKKAARTKARKALNKKKKVVK
jgi:hypothetical protein